MSIVHFDDKGEAFERLGVSNGGRYWYARDIMSLLGYDNYQSFMKAINRAIGTCSSLEISVADNFTQASREIDGETCSDYRLSRFACYLTAMNGDIRKPQVASAQVYFAALAAALQEGFQNSENVQRVQIRDEVSDRERSLSGTVKSSGLAPDKYGFFHNAGYRGMYNMDYSRLRERKGVGSRSLLDFMGKQELAANLFRLTETEAKIRNDGVRGQYALETVAHSVGSRVRETMIATSGTYPEDLPIAEDIKKVGINGSRLGT